MFNLFTSVSLIIISVFSVYEKCDGQGMNQPQKIQFNYTLPSKCTTSAGAYKNGVLIRTIWSNVTASAGDHIDYWDGKNDAGRDTTADSIKVLYSNVQYTFGGVIGAYSSNLSLRNHCVDLCIVGDTAYVATDYNEAHPSEYKYNVKNPESTKSWIFPRNEGHTGASSEAICSDGSNIYIAGRDDWYNDSRNSDEHHYFKTFVYGYRISDGTGVVFSDGTAPYTTSIDGGFHYASGIDEVIDPNANPTGIAVNDKFLFVARAGLNRIDVLNKTTGASIKTITTIDNPRKLKVQNGYLWMIVGNSPTVMRYAINVDGSLTSNPLTLTGIIDPLDIAVSTDGAKIAVSDGSTSQQVKFYNTTTGALITILGQPGGYASTPVVIDDRFMFRNSKDFSETQGGLAFASDGSFLINDIGNYRIQRFNSSLSYINNLMHIGFLYSVHADINDATRIFANYLEYKIDYSKTLTPTGSNGSWTLYKNWSNNVNFSIGGADPDRLKDVSTLSNGKTYALYNFNGGRYEVIELANSGVRFTGVRPAFQGTDDDRRYGMEANGDLLYKRFNPGLSTTWVRRPLTGFSSNNPTYGSDVTIAETPVIDGYDTYPIDETFNRNSITSSGIIATYKSGIHGGSHLGGFPVGASNWQWQSSFATNNKYHGDFPTNGDFDIGNSVQGAGTWYQAVDKSIFDVYRGEFWKANDGAGETNIFNHYYDNGLMVGQFGAIRNDGKEGMAGNNLSGTIVKVGSDYYIYHADEGDYGGIHQIKVSNLSSINIITFPATDIGNEPSIGVDLLAGLPRGDTITNNTAGWTRSDNEGGDLSFSTGARTYNARKSVDVNTNWQKGTVGADWLTRDLGSNSGLNSWTLKGVINVDGLQANDPYGWGGAYIQVLDNNDKVISQFEYNESYSTGAKQWFQGNDKVLVSADYGFINPNLFTYSQPFEISVNVGITTFNFAGYTQTTNNLQDPTANYRAPKKLRLYFFYKQWQQRDRKINIIEMKFINNTTAKSSTSDNFRSKQSGLWADLATWQSSSDGSTWINATQVPSLSASSISIQNGHTVEIPDTLTIDHLNINNGGVLNVDSKATLTVADDTGDDITIASGGSLVIRSDSASTGRIGKSAGTIKGNVTVERFISAKANASYRLLAPSVTTSSSIKANWQEGTNNLTSFVNNNPVPGYGTHITGSLTGQNGFDATADAQVSLFTYNQQSATQAWQSVSNTDVNTLDAKRGYLLYVRGNRGIDLKNAASQTCNTTLRATGAIISGTVIYKDQEGNGRTSLIANPYASPISWTALNASNSTMFENYYTFWDPNIGSKGGYVTVDATGTASVRTSQATTDIQSGQAFLVKAKSGAMSPSFTITEDHKTSTNNPNVFRTANAQMSKLYASLYYTDNAGRRNLADGVLARFDSSYFAKVDGDDAEDVENFDENIALTRSNSTLSIESRPLVNANDTLFLSIGNMKQQAYQWQFDAANFDTSSIRKAYLKDKFTGTETLLSLMGTTVVNFSITPDEASYSVDRFSVVFKNQSALPVKMLSVNASQQNDGILVSWKTATEVNMDRYEVQKSTDGQTFNLAATASVKTNNSLINSYNWLDSKPTDGNNYYRIKSINKDNTFDFSQIVKIFIGDVNMNKGINVFPNPVKNETFSLQLNNLEKGNYTVQLFNGAGQVMLRQSINHNGGSATQTVTANGRLMPGTYQLILSGENGGNYTIKILKV